MKYHVFSQERNPKDLGLRTVSLQSNGDALLMTPDGAKATHRMFRAKVVWMQKEGIWIDGFEETGKDDKHGNPVFRLHSWYLKYTQQ
jgi:hypothetical protein